VHTAVVALAPQRGRRSDAVKAAVKKQSAAASQKVTLASAPARRRRVPLMRASLDSVRRRKPSVSGRPTRSQAPAVTAAPEVAPARVSSRPLRLAAQGVNKLVKALARGRS